MRQKKYGSLMEFALFGRDDEEIDIQTLIATKKTGNAIEKKEKLQPVSAKAKGVNHERRTDK